jgi:ribosome-associated protein
MPLDILQNTVLTALEDLKAVDIRVLTVTELTPLTDIMIFCSGTSTRHVKSIADNVVKQAKQHGLPIRGIEGENEGEWVLVDLGDVIVHVMLPATRDFYQLEKLWGFSPPRVAHED